MENRNFITFSCIGKKDWIKPFETNKKFPIQNDNHQILNFAKSFLLWKTNFQILYHWNTIWQFCWPALLASRFSIRTLLFGYMELNLPTPVPHPSSQGMLLCSCKAQKYICKYLKISSENCWFVHQIDVQFNNNRIQIWMVTQ